MIKKVNPQNILIIEPPGMDAKFVRLQPHQILDNQTLSCSKELCRFLQFMVEDLAVPACLTDRLIGVTFFERGEAFNPSTHPIVRV